MSKAKYDWVQLKQEFFVSNEIEASVFIRSKLGLSEKEFTSNGGVRKQINGWADDKRAWQRERSKATLKEADQELIEKLKIPLTETLAIRNMLSQLDMKILGIFLRIIDEKNPPKKAEISLLKAYPDRLRDIWQRVQIELGMPTNVSQLQGSEDKPLYFKDLVTKARDILGKDAF